MSERIQTIYQFRDRLASDIGKLLDGDRDRRAGRLAMLIEHREDLDGVARNDLALTLEIVARRCLRYARQLRGLPEPGVAMVRKETLPAGPPKAGEESE